MEVEVLTHEQVLDAIKKIENSCLRPNGDIDLLEMSRSTSLFSTWRKLRERVRKEGIKA